MASAINSLSIKHLHQVISFIAWLCALVVLLIGLISPNNKEILLLLTVSSLCLLMFNSVAMTTWLCVSECVVVLRLCAQRRVLSKAGPKPGIQGRLFRMHTQTKPMLKEDHSGLVPFV